MLEPLDHNCLDGNPKEAGSIKGVPLPADGQQVKTKSKSGNNSRSEVLHKPNSIVFVRRRMLYARPALNAKREVRFGLRHIRTLCFIHYDFDYDFLG